MDRCIDDAWRGLPANSLTRWIEGPEFLCQTNESWPKRPAAINTNIHETDPEVKGPTVFANEVRESLPLTIAVQSCSSWNRLRELWGGVFDTRLNCKRRSRRKDQENRSRTNNVATFLSMYLRSRQPKEKSSNMYGTNV